MCIRDSAEYRGAVGQHRAQVGAAHPALVAAAGLVHDGLEGPAVGARDREQLRKEEPLADAAINPDGGTPIHPRRVPSLTATAGPIPARVSWACAVMDIPEIYGDAVREARHRPPRLDLVVDHPARALPILLSLIHISEPTRPY